MSRAIRRVLFWPLLAAFVVWTAWSCLVFPFDRSRLYQAIPVNVTYVSEHLTLAARWSGLSEDMAARSLAQFVGVQERRADGMLGDPELAWLIGRVARRDSLVAYVPRLEFTGPPAWVFSTWVGSQGVRLRAELGLGLLKGFKKETLAGGHTAWRMRRPVTRSGWVLSMAVAEGVLVGCLSPDPRGVQSLVDRVDQNAAMLPELRNWLRAETDPQHEPVGSDFARAADRGWIRWYAGAAEFHDPHWLRFALAPSRGPFAMAWVRGDLGIPLASRQTPPPEASPAGTGATNVFEDLDPLFGDASAAALVLPFAAACEQVARSDLPPFVKGSFAQLHGDFPADSPLVVGLCTTNYSGRLAGLRAPALIIAGLTQGVTNVGAWVAERLDRMNAGFGSSLLAVPAQADPSVLVLDNVGSALLRQTAPGDRPALTMRGRWLVFSSSADVLAALCARPGDPPGADPQPSLLPVSGPSFSGLALNADVARAYECLVKALAVYDLANYTQDEARRAPGRRLMDGVMAWLDAVRPFRSLGIEAHADGSAVEALVRLGDSSDAP